MIVTVSILEIALRFLRPDLIESSSGRQFLFTYDHEIGWVNRPNISAKHKRIDFEVDIEINSRGFRDREYPFTNESNAARIAVLGDSFVWGYGVQEKDRFTEIIESQFKDLEVLNFGTSGYGQDQEFLLMKRDVFRYHPDGVIVVVTAGSDFENNINFFQYGRYKPFFRIKTNGSLEVQNIPVPQSRAARLHQKLQQLLLWTWLSYRNLFGYPVESFVVPFFDGQFDLLKNRTQPLLADKLTCYLCRDMNEYAVAHGSKVLFVIAPNMEVDKTGKNYFLYDPRYEKLITCLKQHNLPALELGPIFQNFLRMHPAKLLTFKHDRHWNEMGHRLVARALAESFVKRQL